MSIEEKLLNSCLQIQAESWNGSIKTGTGFFISPDGLVLTCFHTLKPEDSTVTAKCIRAVYRSIPYVAKCVYIPLNKDDLDFVVLELENLPKPVDFLELARWETLTREETDFRTYGYSSNVLFGNHENGKILGDTLLAGVHHLQFDSYQAAKPGMSGAPVMHIKSQRVVGIIRGNVIEPGQEHPVAVPLGEIAKVCSQVRQILDEQQLFDILTGFLGHEFEKHGILRDLYDVLPIAGLPDYNVLIEREYPRSPAEAVALLLRRRGLLKHLPAFLEAQYRGLPKPKNLPTGSTVHFINREYELEQAFLPEASTCLIYGAPAGYGKTKLFEVIEQRYFREKWLTLPIHIPHAAVSAAELLGVLVNWLGYDNHIPTNSSDLQWAINNAISEIIHIKPRIKGIALLVDGIEHLDDTQIEVLLQSFVLPLQVRSNNESLDFRFHLAGRRVDHCFQVFTRQGLSYRTISMSPFRFKSVRETVKKYMPAQKDTPDLYAAYLMFVTGGHPGCMAEVLNLIGATSDVELAFHNAQPQIDAIVEGVLEKILQSISEDLQKHFLTLSIYRCYDLRLLEKMQQIEVLPPEPDFVKLEEKLPFTYLVERGREWDYSFLRDGVVRRLLALKVMKEPDGGFLKRCQQARQIYKNAIEEYDELTYVMVLEALYQELHCRYFATMQGLSDRIALSEEFFRPGGILDQYLMKLKTKKYWQNMKKALERLLADADQNGEWEFQFIIDFYLRQSDFNDDPYQQLCQRVKAFA
jgi:hypothetical protein